MLAVLFILPRPTINLMLFMIIIYIDITNEKIIGFPLIGKIVLKYSNISKTLGRGSINPHHPPSPLVPRWGYEFACSPRVNLRGSNT